MTILRVEICTLYYGERKRDLEQLLPKELAVFTLQFLNVESLESWKENFSLVFKSENSLETRQATSLDSLLRKNLLKNMNNGVSLL